MAAKVDGTGIWSSRPLSVVKEVFFDAVEIMALLVALSAIDLALPYMKASESFKELFGSIHESAFLGIYMLLAAKGIFRFWRL